MTEKKVLTGPALLEQLLLGVLEISAECDTLQGKTEKQGNQKDTRSQRFRYSPHFLTVLHSAYSLGGVFVDSRCELPPYGVHWQLHLSH